jgi:RNA polymerase subunit RPABC4/transcription elongation factor Spt4
MGLRPQNIILHPRNTKAISLVTTIKLDSFFVHGFCPACDSESIQRNIKAPILIFTNHIREQILLQHLSNSHTKTAHVPNITTEYLDTALVDDIESSHLADRTYL